MSPTKTKKRREDLAAGESLCTYCQAKCCRYFALPIDKPETWQDFDFARWFLLHDRATLFVDSDEPTWNLLVHTTCKHLRSDSLCGIYEQRPQICRDYTTDKCEYEDLWVYDQYFELPEQIVEYAEAVLGPRPGETLRSPKPTEPRRR